MNSLCLMHFVPAKKHVIRCLSFLLLMVGIGSVLGCANADNPNGMQITGIDDNPSIEIDTTYGTLKFPASMEENLRHKEVTEGNVTMEVFYMLLPKVERELFRIYYNAPSMGSALGYLKADTQQVSVTYAVCDYSREDFSDEASWKLYSSMMDGFSMLLNSIQNDERFTQIQSVEAVESTSTKLTYWEITIPETMQCEEMTEGDYYRADFYGMLGGERTLLYSFQLGEPPLESVLGTYMVDETEKVISLESNDLVMQEILSEEEQITLYEMMDSINDVIQAIMNSSNFSSNGQ